MSNYLKIFTNIFLTSVSLSVLLGSFLSIVGPIIQSNQINRKIITVGKSRRFIEKELKTRKSVLSSLYDNKFENFERLEKLITKWESIIKKNPDLDVSCSFLSLDNKEYAEVRSEFKLPAASSIKVPILLVLLTMIDSKEIYWNEKLTLTKDLIGSGSGWMAYQKIGEQFPVFEIATEMIRVSDNTATNLLIKRIGGIKIINQKFKEIGLKNTQINNLLPDLDGTNLTSTKDLSMAIALVDNGFLLNVVSRDIFREIMSTSITNKLIPDGILNGLGIKPGNSDYKLLIQGFRIYNKTGDIGITYADSALLEMPDTSRAFTAFIVKGPFNDQRSTKLIRDMSAAIVTYLKSPNENP